MTSEDTQEKIFDRPYLIALILTILFFALHLFCNFISWRAELWGVFHLSFFKLGQQLLIIVIATIFVGAGYILDWKGIKAPAAEKSFLPLVVLSIIVALSFYFLRIGPFLMGDAVALIGKLEQDFIKFTEAGDILIHRFLFRLLPAQKIASIDTYVGISIASGVVFLAILLVWIRKAGIYLDNPWLIFLSFLSLTSILLYYGYAESYTLLNLTILIFLILSLNVLETGKWILPGLFLLLSIFLHISAICFIPGYVFLLVLMRREDISQNVKRLLKLSVAAALVFIILISLYPSKSQDPLFLRLLPHEGIIYTLFSFTHINDTINELLLVAPVGLIMLLISLPKNNVSRPILLMAAFTLFSVIGMFIVDPVFEAADWDLMSFQGMPILILGFYTARQKGIFVKPWRYIGIVLAIIAFHTLPWVLSNNSLKIAVSQYAEIASSYKHKNPARLFIKGSWSLITIPRNNEYYHLAIILSRYTLDRGIHDPAIYQNCGLAYARLEQYAEAVPYFKKAVELYPDRYFRKAEAYSYLAVTLLQTDDFVDANEAAKKSLILKASFKETLKHSEVWLWDVIIAYQLDTEPESAMTYARRVLDLAPQYPNSYINYGLALAANDRLNEAIIVWQEGSIKFPDDKQLKELLKALKNE